MTLTASTNRLKTRQIPLRTEDVTCMLVRDAWSDLLLASHRIDRDSGSTQLEQLNLSGIAVISVDFTEVAYSPNPLWFSQIHAFTK
jgi:hypothetical protein